MSIANGFNDYFINIGPTLADKFLNYKSPNDYWNASNNKSISITPTGIGEIITIGVLQKSNASTG